MKDVSKIETATSFLKENFIPFSVKNEGVHLIVEGATCFIDYWPTTGKWISRNGTKGFGVAALVKYVQQGQDTA